MPKTIYIAGHQGMVGSALCRALQASDGRDDIALLVASRQELDLVDQRSVNDFFSSNKIDQVYLAAAKVGGIHANDHYSADFIYDNLMIECNVINAAFRSGVEKLLFLSSSCSYPRSAAQPMHESSLLSGPLELTNEAYAVAKIAGIKLCESYSRQHEVDYRSVMPTNLYGPNDNFHPENSHVIPAMMQRFHAAKVANEPEVVIWGTGSPRREFLHVDDMAAASLHVMNLPLATYNLVAEARCSHINVGSGVDCSIRELAELMRNVVGFKGQIRFDSSKPDGTPRKLLNVARLNSLGWQSDIKLSDGLREVYRWFMHNNATLRGLEES